MPTAGARAIFLPHGQEPVMGYACDVAALDGHTGCAGDRPETVPLNWSAKASASSSVPNAASTLPASLLIAHLNISSSKLATLSHALMSSILETISPVGRRTLTVSMGFP